MNIDMIPIGSNPPYDVNVIIEIPIGGQPVKYELDKASGAMYVDRFLHTAMYYPCNYGFIPHTLSEDGDPTDVIIISQRHIVPGAVMAVRPVGVLKMVDEAGGDEKIVAVPASRISKRYDDVKDYTDLPGIMMQQVEHFFTHYKDLEDNKWSRTDGWGDHKEAERMIMAAIERAKTA